jgi:hypothetical protein
MPKHIGEIKDYPIVNDVYAFGWFSKRKQIVKEVFN